MLKQCCGDFSQSRAKDRVSEICLCLIEAADAVEFGIGAATKYCQLRKDKPYPMRTFMPLGNFLKGNGVVELLRFDETFGVETVGGIRGYVVNKLLGQNHVFHIYCVSKERCNLRIAKSGNAASYSGDEKGELAVLFGKADKLVDIRFDGLHAALHGGNGVCTAVQTYAFAPYGAKLPESQSGSTAAMCACQIAAKHEYLVFSQFRNHFGSVSSVIHI